MLNCRYLVDRTADFARPAVASYNSEKNVIVRSILGTSSTGLAATKVVVGLASASNVAGESTIGLS
jgi:hypothetical protein